MAQLLKPLHLAVIKGQQILPLMATGLQFLHHGSRQPHANPVTVMGRTIVELHGQRALFQVECAALELPVKMDSPCPNGKLVIVAMPFRPLYQGNQGQVQGH